MATSSKVEESPEAGRCDIGVNLVEEVSHSAEARAADFFGGQGWRDGVVGIHLMQRVGGHDGWWQVLERGRREMGMRLEVGRRKKRPRDWDISGKLGGRGDTRLRRGDARSEGILHEQPCSSASKG